MSNTNRLYLVTMVTDEHWFPYQRPPLWKDFLLDATTEQNLILRDKAFLELQGSTPLSSSRKSSRGKCGKPSERSAAKPQAARKLLSVNDHALVLIDSVALRCGGAFGRRRSPGLGSQFACRMTFIILRMSAGSTRITIAASCKCRWGPNRARWPCNLACALRADEQGGRPYELKNRNR